MTHYLMRLWSEQEAQNLPEFALLLFLVCLTVVSAMGGVANKVRSMYSNVSTHMAAAGNSTLKGGSVSYAAETPVEKQSESKDVTKKNSID